jgi:hypothetical protein
MTELRRESVEVRVEICDEILDFLPGELRVHAVVPALGFIMAAATDMTMALIALICLEAPI